MRSEYQSVKQPGLALVAGIDASVTSFQTGVPVTFSSDDNCLTGLSYSWKFHWTSGAVVVGTNPTLNYTFTQPGSYELSLTVSNQYGSATHTKSICVELNPTAMPTLTVANVSGLFPAFPYEVRECFDTNAKIFTITNLPSCSEAGECLGYAWQKYDALGGFWRPLSFYDPSGDFTGHEIEFFVYGGDVIRCLITIQSGGGTIPQCSGETPNERVVSATFTFVPAQGGCQ
jgi:PKD repeat protein